MSDPQLKSLQLLLADMLEDEDTLKKKPKDDLYAQGQLAATQFNRVKLETILGSFGYRRLVTLDSEPTHEND